VVFVAVVFSASVDDIAVDFEITAEAVDVVGFVAVAVVVANTFSAIAELLPLHVVGALGVETNGGGGSCTDNSTPS